MLHGTTQLLRPLLPILDPALGVDLTILQTELRGALSTAGPAPAKANRKGGNTLGEISPSSTFSHFLITGLRAGQLICPHGRGCSDVGREAWGTTLVSPLRGVSRRGEKNEPSKTRGFKQGG